MAYSVYCCGSNGKYQLGNGTDDDLNELQRVWTTDVPVKKIACGGNHSLVLLTNGELYVAGDNSVGQCGIEGQETIPHFTRLGESLWKDCSAGYEYSVLVTFDDRIHTTGFGPKGELGLGPIRKTDTLQVVDFEPRSSVVFVKSCLDHNVMLLENGKLYGWGNGRSGKVGEPTESKVSSPREISTPKAIREVDVGRDFTVISDGTRITLLGKDKYGIIPHLPSDIKSFRTMWSSIHVVTSQNRIISLGNNSHGQTIPDSETPFRLFSVGSEHGIVVQERNKVMSWGWGEHGNCGLKRAESVTFDYFNKMRDFGDEEVIMVHGGCATTWVVTRS